MCCCVVVCGAHPNQRPRPPPCAARARARPKPPKKCNNTAPRPDGGTHARLSAAASESCSSNKAPRGGKAKHTHMCCLLFGGFGAGSTPRRLIFSLIARGVKGWARRHHHRRHHRSTSSRPAITDKAKPPAYLPSSPSGPFWEPYLVAPRSLPPLASSSSSRCVVRGAFFSRWGGAQMEPGLPATRAPRSFAACHC